MIDRFPGLRHDAVIGGHDEHDDVGDLGAAGAHHRERGVAGRVKEHDALARLFAGAHQVGADVLRDAAGFALGDAGLADRVEQRRLAVIDVAHDRHDRPARDQVLRIGDLVALGADFLLEAARLDLGAEIRGERFRGLEVDGGVDRHHQPAIEQRLEGVLDAHFEAIGQILHRHAFREGDGARDRRRRGLRGRLLRTLERFALLGRFQTRRAMLLLRTESRSHRRLAGTLRHARRRPHRLGRQRPRPAKHRRGVALQADAAIRTDAVLAVAPGCRSRPAADAAERAARRAAAAARVAASAAAAARSAEPFQVPRRASGCSAARSGRPSRARSRPRVRRLAPRQRIPLARVRQAEPLPRESQPLQRARLPRPATARPPRPVARRPLRALVLPVFTCLDQSRRTKRGRGRFRRLRRGRGSTLLAGRGFRLRRCLGLLHGLLGEHVTLRQGDALLLGHALDELAGDDLFERARRALELDAVVLLQQLPARHCWGCREAQRPCKPEQWTNLLPSVSATACTTWFLRLRRPRQAAARPRPERLRHSPLRARRTALRLPCASLPRS